MEKNKDTNLNVLEVNPKIKELVKSNPELGSYLDQLSKNLNNAVSSFCEAYGVLDILKKNMSIGSNYKDDMTSEADSIRAVLKILNASMGKVSDTADSMQFTTFNLQHLRQD